jgi:hypothetical protein
MRLFDLLEDESHLLPRRTLSRCVAVYPLVHRRITANPPANCPARKTGCAQLLLNRYAFRGESNVTC